MAARLLAQATTAHHSSSRGQPSSLAVPLLGGLSRSGNSPGAGTGAGAGGPLRQQELVGGGTVEYASVGWVFCKRLGALLRLLRPYAALLLALLSVAEAYTTARVGIIIGSFYRIMLDRQLSQFLASAAHAAALYCCAALVASTTDGLAELLALRWRGALTRALQQLYCSPKADLYCRLALPPAPLDGTSTDTSAGAGSKMDNLDQRITQDAALLCATLGDVAKVVVAVPLKLVYYSYWTYHYMSLVPLLLVYAFFLTGCVIQRLVMAPLARYVYRCEQCEGDLRYAHMRLRQYAVEVALAQGAEAEGEQLEGLLSTLLSASQRLVLQRWLLGITTRGLEYSGSLLNYACIAVPVFVTGAWAGLDSGELAQAISNASFMCLTLIYSFTQLLELGGKLGTLAGLMPRVVALLEALETAVADAGEPSSKAAGVPTQPSPRLRAGKAGAGAVGGGDGANGSGTRRSSMDSWPSEEHQSACTELRRTELTQLLHGPSRAVVGAATAAGPAPEIEFTVHALGSGLAADLVHIFPQAPPTLLPHSPTAPGQGGRSTSGGDAAAAARRGCIHAVVTFQCARDKLVLTSTSLEGVSPEVISEMDWMLAVFVGWQQQLYERLTQQHYWCDAIDPRTGMAMHGPPGDRWSEVTAANLMLGYSKSDEGICPIVLHPEFGHSSYPATVFTDAPLNVILDALAAAGPPGPPGPSRQPRPPALLQLVGATCHTAGGALIAQGLDLAVGPAGDSLLVTGPSGCGKSTLLSALRTLWPMYAALRCMPPLDQVMFVAQRPFPAPGGSLRMQLEYPGAGAAAVGDTLPGRQGEDGGGLAAHSCLRDGQLLAALTAVGLGYLADRTGHNLDEPIDWQGGLSLGELQRLSFARLLLRQPLLAVLDEATSAVGPEREAQLYSLLRTAGISVLSVGQQHSTLQQLHGTVLHLHGDGTGEWSVVQQPGCDEQ